MEVRTIYLTQVEDNPAKTITIEVEREQAGISEVIGHKGEKIMKVYLKSFSNEVIDEANSLLL